MKKALALFPVLLASGCFSVKPLTAVPETLPMPEPKWETAKTTGLIFRDERIAARSETTSFSTANATATYADQNAYASATGVSAGSTAVFESYDNNELQRLLKYTLEDSGLIGTFSQSSTIEIEGIIYKARATTSGWLMLRNFLTLAPLCLPPYLGFPVTGTNEAVIQLRVRENGKLIARSTGKAESQWYSHLYPIETCRHESTKLAAKKAIILAVQDLQKQAVK